MEVVVALTLLMFLGASESAATICIQPRIEVERAKG